MTAALRRAAGGAEQPAGGSLLILGTRGIPGRHGGFETFAERLALYLVERGWTVTVYCQAGEGGRREDRWRGVRRVHLGERGGGALGSIAFDWAALRDARRRPGVVLTLGYNTALFNRLLVDDRRQLINMDGLEWQRRKWGPAARAFLWWNERLAARGRARLVADHPAIAERLVSLGVDPGRISTIAYGADPVRAADPACLEPFGLEPGEYCLLLARLEPENSVLEVVEGYSRQRRGLPLVVVGDFRPQANGYHRRLRAAAGEEVRFVGACYRSEQVRALRRFARLYVHGHTVGGTNPSLVESMAAGSPVIAQDNRFNRGVLGEAGRYFDGPAGFARSLEALLEDRAAGERLGRAVFARFSERYTWEHVLPEYRRVLSQLMESLPR